MACVDAGGRLGRGVCVDVEAGLAGSLIGAAATAHAAGLGEHSRDPCAEEGLLIYRIDNSDARTPVLPVRLHGGSAVAAYACPTVVPRKLQHTRRTRRCIGQIGIEKAPAVLDFVIGAEVVPAKAKVEREFAAYLPVV